MRRSSRNNSCYRLYPIISKRKLLQMIKRLRISYFPQGRCAWWRHRSLARRRRRRLSSSNLLKLHLSVIESSLRMLLFKIKNTWVQYSKRGMIYLLKSNLDPDSAKLKRCLRERSFLMILACSWSAQKLWWDPNMKSRDLWSTSVWEFSKILT